MWPFIVLQVATVLAIMFFFRMLLHKQLESGFKRIQVLDRNNLKKEEELNRKLKKIDEEYAGKIDEAKRLAQGVIEAAKESVKAMREEERAKIKDEAKRIIASAIEQKERSVKGSEREIFKKGVDLAGAILRRALSEDELKGFRQKVSKEVIEALFQTEDLIAALKKNPKIEIITADPMTPEEKKRLSNLVKKISGNKTKETFTVDKSVLGGLLLKIGDKIIDAGISCRINRVASDLKKGDAEIS